MAQSYAKVFTPDGYGAHCLFAPILENNLVIP